jgi:hypothetical protein
MSSSEQAAQPSPWISVWLKPRQTIERILAERPRRGALLLGSVGVMSGSMSQLLGVGIKNRLFDWPIVVALAVVCAIGGWLACLSRHLSSNGAAGGWVDEHPPPNCARSSHGV